MPKIIVTATVKDVAAWLEFKADMTAALSAVASDGSSYVAMDTDRILIRQPLTITDSLEKFDISVIVRGGGISGQAGAIRHAISRALADLNPDLRLPLKKAALLTRDARVRERKKYGMRGARARYQYSKR